MAYEGMIAETIGINGDKNETISAYVARPLGPGPFPGMVLLHHAPGWDEWYREATRKFAHHGYAAISPNLYHRAGEGKSDDVAAKVRAEGGVPDAQVIGDTEGAVRWLKAQPWLNGKVGVFGTCSGGRQTFLYACHTKSINAACELWGGRVVMSKEELNPKQPTPPIEFTRNLSCPLLGLFGNEDRSPTPEQVDQHEAELKKHGKNYEFHRYDGAGHGFFYYDRPAYRIEQALDGWQKVFAFSASTWPNDRGSASLTAMCTSIVEIVEAAGAGKAGDGWIELTHSVVSYDHPHHAVLEEAITIDFVNSALGPGARVAVELTLESAKELSAALARAIAAAEIEESARRHTV
jgi:carboxymethylenebutenolidase